MWTAKFISKNKTEDKVRVVVEITDGVKVFQKEYYFDSPTVQLIRQKVLNDIEAIEKRESFNVTNGQSIDITPETAPSPTQEEIDRDLFWQDYERYLNVSRLVDMGLVLATNPKVVALKTKVINGLKLEYFS